MSQLEQQVIELRRQMDLLKRTQVVISDTKPRSPSSQSIWRDGALLKTWDWKNWIDTTGSSTILDFTTSVVFSSTAYNNVTWSAGVINIGTNTWVASHSIGAGSFTMTANTFLYWDPSAPTSIQTTTTPATAITSWGIIVAVGQRNSDSGASSASIKTFGNNQNDLITADQIVANAITANKLATTLIYAGSIVLNTNGLIRWGQTAYNTGTGFFIGYSGTDYKLSMGNGSTKAFTYDGTDITITGGIIQTGTSGQRVVISGSIIESYDSSGVSRWKTNSNGYRLVNEYGTLNTDVIGDSLWSSAAMKVSWAIKCDGIADTGTGMNIYTHGWQITFQGYWGTGNGITLSSTVDSTLVLSGDTITLNWKNLYSDGTNLFWNGIQIN